MSNKSILQEAEEIVNGSRASDYGSAIESADKIAKVANILIGEDVIKPEYVFKVMMAVKVVREGVKHKRDNLVDLAGYAELQNRVEDS